ncbi:GntR family transcriptional regulator [Paenibacillus elgii]|uniref:GntR family transcriptional regulator n=1 Tax=Paenibacillus elgii TaxID=189691 RepID=A0A163U4N5_9BACL|nr:GntR family transcriptional regulator [Paenibacillus elgii]KZE72813.1 GntR family transcriptional regulator [Paenibacillus elgii]MCM3268623.1 GntR family transcriptional regulator [Paenibacillus elgii]NEN83533.1 GntR family transcriptional regulator [Paenibacillus elgii]PUA40128.1 GntR family transcriptional regulator [Paenibacillus elgii]
MNITFDDKQPIFQQVANIIEDDILNGTFRVDEQILSVAQFSQLFQINPATVVKGIALLVNEGILYKKRGLGMYVATDARQKIQMKRRDRFYKELLSNLLNEADKLGLTTEEIMDMIKQLRKE